VTALAAADLPWREADARLAGPLLLSAVVSAGLDRRATPVSVRGSFQSAWCLPVAVLLPPEWAVVAPVPLAALACWRADRDFAHCRVTAGAAAGLGFGAASLAFHASGIMSRSVSMHAAPEWLAAVVACGVLEQVTSNGLTAVALRGSGLRSHLRAFSFGPDLPGAMAEVCSGVLVAFAATANPWYAIFAVPLVIPLQRSWQHKELVRTARTDAKTGLLNAAAWQEAANAEASRAARTGRPVAVAMLDIDHFKKVNDAHGHLAGDRVLAALAAVLAAQLRGYDVAGRFGGEEFTVLLPDTTEVEACGIAERLRAQIAATPMLDDREGIGPALPVTVSIGVAAARPGRRTGGELIGAADQAMFAAKQAGRNQVHPPSSATRQAARRTAHDHQRFGHAGMLRRRPVEDTGVSMQGDAKLSRP
jgi:diguanylate cyclase (GGDEF)-like protein